MNRDERCPWTSALGVAWELSGPSLQATEELSVRVIMHKIVQLIALLTCPNAGFMKYLSSWISKAGVNAVISCNDCCRFFCVLFFLIVTCHNVPLTGEDAETLG